MDRDLFADQAYGKVALMKMGALPANFRLYEAGWLGKRSQDWNVMEVKGAEFRVAQRGPHKGKLAIKLSGTDRTVHFTREEIQAVQETPAGSSANTPTTLD